MSDGVTRRGFLARLGAGIVALGLGVRIPDREPSWMQAPKDGLWPLVGRDADLLWPVARARLQYTDGRVTGWRPIYRNQAMRCEEVEWANLEYTGEIAGVWVEIRDVGEVFVDLSAPWAWSYVTAGDSYVMHGLRIAIGDEQWI